MQVQKAVEGVMRRGFLMVLLAFYVYALEGVSGYAWIGRYI